jgi:hypothetical protein
MEADLLDPEAVLANEAFPKGSPRPDLLATLDTPSTGRQVRKTLERIPLMPTRLISPKPFSKLVPLPVRVTHHLPS